MNSIEVKDTVPNVVVCKKCGTITPSLAEGLSKGCKNCHSHLFEVITRQEYEQLNKITAMDFKAMPAIKISLTGKMLINLNHLLTSDTENLVVQDSTGKFYISTNIQ